MKHNKAELLAPAGSYDSLRAAVNAGCDAVYIGGTRFGARAYAKNQGEEELLRAIDYVHLYGKKLYLTVNTLLKDEELSALYDFLFIYYQQGLDAVIVQDVGVLDFIYNHFPKLPIHASTQMSLMMAQGATAIKPYGVTRLVPGRELSIGELKRMRRDTDLEIEVFVHGALCYSYSGQCLMSSMIGGRSGNRGRCAQPCRQEYLVPGMTQNQGNYILSLKDLCTLGLLPEILETGVNSLKIEGRMKGPEYTAIVTAAYRRQLDLYYSGKKLKGEELSKEITALKEAYNRGGLCTGYWKENNKGKMISMDRPNHSGIKVGTVISVKKNTSDIKVDTDLLAGDVLEIRDQYKTIYEFTLGKQSMKGDELQANFSPGSGVAKGNTVFRTRNESLLRDIKSRFLEQDRKIPLCGEFFALSGQPMMLRVYTGDLEAAEYGELVENAQNQPVTEEWVRTKLNKTGDSLFYFDQLDIKLGDFVFLPVRAVNEIRRKALLLFRDLIVNSYRRLEAQREETISMPAAIGKPSIPQVMVRVSTREQFMAVCTKEFVHTIIAELSSLGGNEIEELSKKAKHYNKQFILALPYICRAQTFDWLEQSKNQIFSDLVDGYLLRNLEEVTLIRGWKKEEAEDSKKEILLDHSLYVMNRRAKEFWINQGFNRMTLPLELNKKEWIALGCADMDLVVYGRIPMMISAQCVLKNLGRCHKGERTILTLKDHKGHSFPVVNDCFCCSNIIYNSSPYLLFDLDKELSMLHPLSYRLDFTIEDTAETEAVLHKFLESKLLDSYTRGHYRRGIL